MVARSAGFRVLFDFEKYCRERKGEVVPRKRFRVQFSGEGHPEYVRASLEARKDLILRSPSGMLAHPYIVPGGVYDELWDWDAFFCGMSIAGTSPVHYTGSIVNILEHVRQDGRPPKLMTPDGGGFDWMPIPIHAQWLLLASRMKGDVIALAEQWERLKACRNWFEKTCAARRGLYRLSHVRGYGLDNDPVVYGRPDAVVGPVDTNCYHYREHMAMAAIATSLGLKQEAQEFTDRAVQLREAINEYMWDPVDGMFYALDLSEHFDVTGQTITWEIPYKIRTCASLWALWSGVADRDMACRMIREHVLNPAEYLSRYGIRSLAANERMYNNLPMGNPSNWQGGVWGVSTFVTAYGLARYGFVQEARDLALRLTAVFAGDLRKNGVLHEYYDAEDGSPVIKPGFLSWNMLAARVNVDLENGTDPFALPGEPCAASA